MMESGQVWQDIIVRVLGRKFKKCWQALTLDLLVVDLGIKPGLLFDYGKASIPVITHLIQEAREKQLLLTCLQVVVIEMDLIITHPGSYKGYKSIIFQSVMFIDVSVKLEYPQMITEEGKVLPTILALDDVKDMESYCCIELGPNSFTNPSTLFGLFLGYPVVYWYDMFDQKPGNCLSSEPLRSFKVTGTVKQIDNYGGISKGDNFEHTVFSFSIPERLMPDTDFHVKQWFDNLNKKIAWKTLFSELELKEETVQYATVCL